MPLFVSNQQDKVAVGPDLERLLARLGKQAIAGAALPEDAEISVALVDDQEIRNLNRTYRNIDAATDVLAFALNEPGHDEPWLQDPGEGRYVGDVAISLETARRQAEEYGHSLEREIAYLAAHGILHLAGYDHQLEQGARLMQAKEEALLATVGLADTRSLKPGRRRTGTGKAGLSGEEARAFLAGEGIMVGKLLAAAAEARRHAYAPYSGLAVGAAVLGRSGRIYRGCNVENASYGLTTCAERGAVMEAVLGGEKGLAAVAVVSRGDVICLPCGSCRQILAEFGPDMAVIAQQEGDDDFVVCSLTELLPAPFRF